MIKEGKKMKNLHQSILQERMKNANLDKLSGPFSVAFTVTNKCNYRCRHCYNNSGQNIYRELTDDRLINIARQISELKPMNVCLCGGEPLIRGKVIYDIIHFLRREMLDFTAFPVFFVTNLLLVQRKKYYFNRATVSRNCSIVL